MYSWPVHHRVTYIKRQATVHSCMSLDRRRKPEQLEGIAHRHVDNVQTPHRNLPTPARNPAWDLLAVKRHC